MPAATSLPLFYPGDVRHAFVKDDGIRRVARVAGWQQGTRLLHVGCGLGWPAMFLAETIGAHVTAVDTDDTSLDTLRGLVKARSLTDAVDVRKIGDLSAPGFSAGEFEGILIDNRIALTLDKALATFRKLLQAKGKLALLYPVKVGRLPNAQAVEFWEKKLGESLRTPRDVLQLLEQSGFEPQSVESLSDQELDEFYKGIEPSVARLSDAPRAELLKKEIELHKTQSGKASVSFAMVIGRRKEPGEKPPASRSQG